MRQHFRGGARGLAKPRFNSGAQGGRECECSLLARQASQRDKHS